MADMENPKIYSADDRSEESAYAQSRAAEQKPAAELKREEVGAEYARILRTLLENINTATKELNIMRSQGIPDRAAYEKIRDRMTAEYDRFREVLQLMVDFHEELEDAYTAAMRFDIEEAQEPEPVKAPEEPEPVTEPEAPEPVTASEEEELAQMESLGHYNKEVGKLLDLAAELEENVKAFEQQGILDKLRPTIKQEMQDILGKLRELDQNSTAKDQSRERESLIDVLGKIDEMLEEPAQTTATSSPLAGIRATHGEVKAQYVVARNERGETLEESITRKDDEETLRSAKLEEDYNEEVRKLLGEAMEVEADVERLAKNNNLDETRPAIRAVIAGILERLKALNAQRANTTPSREWESLIGLLSKISERLEEPTQTTAISSPLAGIRAAHSRVKAQYAAVQHTLSEDQRREMRLSIASMREAVTAAENEAWSRMFDGTLAQAALEPIKPIPPPEPPLESAIQYAVANATEHAPALASAAFASLPTAIATPHVTERRGFFAAISDAFKLK